MNISPAGRPGTTVMSVPRRAAGRSQHERHHHPIPHSRDHGFVARRQNTLQGFAEAKLPSGMILHDVGIYIDNGRAWATPASKPMLDRNGVAMRDDRGKIRYIPIITFATKKLRDRFSEAIIEAMRIAHPDALVPSA